MSKASECALCKAEKLTHWYDVEEISDFCWVADCVKCKVPMFVYKKHTIALPGEHLHKMVWKAVTLFPDLKLDFRRRAIPDHFHFHLRKAV